MNELIALEPLSLGLLIVNLVLGTLLSSILAWYYARFGEALSNRHKFARLMPILCLATVLVISVVKASLALSLGLVGALSIVRFRTAIKDPEELIYLFLVIAIGIGLGADQIVPTVTAVNNILAQHAQFVDMRRLDRRSDSLHMTYLLDCKDQETLAQLLEDLEQHLAHCTFSLVDQGNTPT
jgi:membrane-associated HD superfamily phosphohydrolase